MTRPHFEDLGSGPWSSTDWRVVVAAPGPWVRINEPRNARAAYAWRLAAERAVRDAGIPSLRSVKVEAELRLPDDQGPGRLEVGPYLRTAQLCVQGLKDAVGVGCMPSLRKGPSVSAASGEVVLHIAGEPR